MNGTLREVAPAGDNPRIRVRLDGGGAACIYADHPSTDDLARYLNRRLTLVVDSNGTVRDFFSESDDSYPVRRVAERAGVLDGPRYDNRRREKFKAFHRRLKRIGQQREVHPVRAFEEYPYLVMRCPADERPFGLPAATRVAVILGLPPEVRCRGEVEYDIVRKGDKGDPDDRAAGGGHTCYPSELYFRPFVDRYGFDTVQAQVAHLVANGRLVYDEDRQIVASPKAVRFRDAIVQHLTDVAEDPPSDADADTEMTDVDPDDDRLPLSDAQREAVRRARTAAVTVVIGPAGTGKTRVVQEIERELGDAARLCAPTGKAARRMGENATTIHRFLGTFDPKRKDRESERALAPRLDPGDLVVVDEASMLDFSVAYMVFKLAAEKRLRLLFVGDPFQLPSVEWGTVLDDLIAWARRAGCLVELSSVFRQGEESGLLRVATAIRDGAGVSLNSLEDVEYVTFDSELDMVADVARRWKTCQIITPTNGVGSAINLKVLARRGMEEGDKVICLRNQDSGCARNGDIGFLIGFSTEDFPVEGNPGGKPRRQRVAAFRTEDGGQVLKALAKDMAHAYAITVHKAQGSEWDNVCLAVKGGGWGFVNKKLLYTAVTRAKRRLTIATVGQAFARGTRTDAPRRYSLGL